MAPPHALMAGQVQNLVTFVSPEVSMTPGIWQAPSKYLLNLTTHAAEQIAIVLGTLSPHLAAGFHFIFTFWLLDSYLE